MPLHKSQRGRLDPTMISAPLGDFRHTMHIGRGGDAFGDTSFLATQGSASADSSTPSAGAASDSDPLLNHSTTDGNFNSQDSSKLNQLQHSESVSSFDLDLDLGPSILGDVLGVMDGLNLDTDWTTGKGGDEEEVFSPTRGALETEMETVDVESTVSSKNEMNEKRRMDGAEGGENGEQGMEQLNDGNGWKAKGLKPKVRFSEKREEIIGQLVEADSPGVDGGEEMEYPISPTAQVEHGGTGTASQDQVPGPGEAEPANHRADSPPSSMSSVSSEYEGVAPLDRRRENEPHSETDSEEEEEEEGADGQRGYTFEDEFDDEIGV